MKTRLVLLGPPACGKGTQAEKIKERYGIPSVSPGAMLRDEMRRGTPLGIEADRVTRDGSMVSDELVISLVRSWIETHDQGFVFDGFPRSVGQAEALEQLLAERQEKLDAVLFFDVPDELVCSRAMNRLTCEKCGRTFEAGAGIGDQCPVCGGKLGRRGDDTLEAFQHRMQQYREKTAPLIEYYRGKGLLRIVKPAQSPDTVFGRIAALLEEPQG